MQNWHAEVTAQVPERITSDQLAAIHDGIGGVSALAHDPGTRRVTLTFTVDTNSLAAATDAALAVAIVALASAGTPAAPEDMLACKVTHPDLLADELGQPFVGLTEIGDMLGVTRQRAAQLAGGSLFPAPVFQTSAGRFWSRPAVREWAELRGRKVA